jgi:polyhydroxyalkanoate synthase subunit PhaE
MSDPYYTKLVGEAWTQGSKALTAAQQAMMTDLAGRLLMPGTMLPLQALMSNNSNLQNATEAFQKLMSAWRDLPSSVISDKGGTQNRITSELLQKIFDPREWMNAVGFMDETVRRLSEGPTFADVGQVESKFAALATAWSELRAASVQYHTHLLDAWTKAASEFAIKLNEATSKNATIGSRKDLVGMWVDVANRHHLEVQSTPAFLETQRKLLRASTAFRLAQQDLTGYYSELLGLPTRAEIDDLTRTVSELRRDFRAERRARQRESALRSSAVKPKGSP